MSGPKNPIPAYLAWTDASGAYRSFQFDVVEDEHWSGGGEVTKNPVEEGAKVSDNRRTNPRRVVLRVFATNEPLGTNNWVSPSLGPGAPVSLPSIKGTTGTHLISAPQWDSKLDLRVLAGTAAGLVGGAVGGAIGGRTGSAVGGTLGAVAGSALAGALLKGEVRPNFVKTDASQIHSASSPKPFTPPHLVTFAEEDDFVLKTIAQLEEFDATGQTLDVFGTKTQCIGPPGIGGMVIDTLDHDRNYRFGTGASITIALEQVRIVSSATVPTPAPTIPDSAPPVSKGNQATFNMESDVQAQTAADAAGPFTSGYAAGNADAAAALQ